MYCMMDLMFFSLWLTIWEGSCCWPRTVLQSTSRWQSWPLFNTLHLNWLIYPPSNLIYLKIFIFCSWIIRWKFSFVSADSRIVVLNLTRQSIFIFSSEVKQYLPRMDQLNSSDERLLATIRAQFSTLGPLGHLDAKARFISEWTNLPNVSSC